MLYAEGVSLGHFPSPWQRSLHNEPNLRAQPWWTPEDTGYQRVIQQLEEQWEVIRRYATTALTLYKQNNELFVLKIVVWPEPTKL